VLAHPPAGRSQLSVSAVGADAVAAALNDMAVTDAIAAQQIQFYMNQARPSAVLSTDLTLDKDQTQGLRDRWDEQTRGMQQGKTPILTHGLKVNPWSSAAVATRRSPR
jgi:hypothetical protein